jgi:hypothetical protein
MSSSPLSTPSDDGVEITGAFLTVLPWPGSNEEVRTTLVGTGNENATADRWYADTTAYLGIYNNEYLIEAYKSRGTGGSRVHYTKYNWRQVRSRIHFTADFARLSNLGILKRIQQKTSVNTGFQRDWVRLESPESLEGSPTTRTVVGARGRGAGSSTEAWGSDDPRATRARGRRGGVGGLDVIAQGQGGKATGPNQQGVVASTQISSIQLVDRTASQPLARVWFGLGMIVAYISIFAASLLLLFVRRVYQLYGV